MSLNLVSKKGFAFSFDAFVAFVLSMTVISTLFIFVNLPSGYYEEYQQLYLIGQDTIRTMEVAEYASGTTYSEELAYWLGADPDESCNLLREFIPIQYAFMLEAYDNYTDTWDVVCERRRMEGSIHSHPSCKEFKKMKVALPFVIIEYSEEPDYEQQYGYQRCSGDWTPCATPEPIFNPGTVNNKLLKLTLCV